MQMKKGFTLIELLMVVLILGILVGFALPQYRRSVSRSFTTEGGNVISAVVRAMNAYSAEYNKKATDIKFLSIAMKNGDLQFYQYELTDGPEYDVRIFPREGSSNKTSAVLYVVAAPDGSAQSLGCIGEDCNLYREFNCTSSGERTECKRF